MRTLSLNAYFQHIYWKNLALSVFPLRNAITNGPHVIIIGLRKHNTSHTVRTQLLDKLIHHTTNDERSIKFYSLIT